LAVGGWLLAFGGWRLAFSFWRLAVGDWRLAFGGFVENISHNLRLLPKSFFSLLS
jgi:hypothetical protein